MSKDPAFLFYPKDWLQGTSKLMPAEKGIYIDLLAHQHQDGSIPSDTRRLARMVGMSHDEFLPLWDVVKLKFKLSDGGVLVNQKLTTVVTNRSTKSKTKKISGTLASLIRLSSATQDQKEKIKKMFRINDFVDFDDHLVNQEVTKWFSECLKSIATANGNTISNDNSIIGVVIFDAEKEILKNQIEFERICMVTGKDPITGKESLHKYHLFLEEKEQYPKTKKSVFAGFEKWLINEKQYSKNGTKGNTGVGRTIEFDRP